MIKGIIATKAITPKESVPLFEAPIVNDKIKVEVKGPEATPPESKAIPVNKSGLKIISISAKEYPGIKIHFISKAQMHLKSDNPIASAVPTDKNSSKNFRLIVPPLTPSTCSLKTHTAGSAQTMIAPRRKPVPIKIAYQIPPRLIA